MRDSLMSGPGGGGGERGGGREGGICHWMRTCDPDYVFAFQTPKLVKVVDRRLGLLNYFFMISIFSYIMVFKFCFKHGYLKVEKPSGLLRTQTHVQCGDVGVSACKPVIARRAAQLPYCNQAQNASGGYHVLPPTSKPVRPHWQLPCQWLDTDESLEGEKEFYPTRLETGAQYMPAGCFPYQSVDCQWMINHTSTATTGFKFFAAQTEWYTVKLDHSLAAPSTGLYVSGNDMFGNIEKCDENDENCVDIDPCDDYAAHGFECPPIVAASKPNSQGRTIVPIQTLLRAAGIDSLDSTSDLEDRQDNSYRYNGLVLQVSIDYSNIPAGLWMSSKSLETYRWTMKVNHVPGAEYKIENVKRSPIPGQRHSSARHGIKLFVSFGGKVGVDDWMNTGLLTLVKSIAMISVAKLTVNFLMMYVMREKKTYLKYVREFTPDIDEIRADLRMEKANPDNEFGETSRVTFSRLGMTEMLGKAGERLGALVGLDTDAEHYHQDHLHDHQTPASRVSGGETVTEDASPPVVFTTGASSIYD